MSHQVPDGLGTVKELVERFDAAVRLKGPWIDHMREAYDYALPQRETFHWHAAGQKKNTHIFDSTAIDSTQRFAARVVATLAPPWRRWARLTPGSQVSEDQRENVEVQQQLEDATDTLFAHLRESNFDQEFFEFALDIAIGTADIEVYEGETTMFQFKAVPLAELFIEEGPNGQVENRWRREAVKARHVTRRWPNASLGPSLERMAREQPDKDVTLIVGIIFEPTSREYHLVVIDRDTAGEPHLMFTHNYGPVSPAVVERWQTVAGETYGRGPVMSALPDIKTANKVVEYTLRNAAYAVAGMYTARDDGVLNPYNVRLVPGGVLPVDSNERGNPSIAELPRSGNFDVGQLVLDDLRFRIRQMLFNRERRPDDPVRSATEVAIENMELIQDIGSNFGRLQNALKRLIARCVFILVENGKLPPVQVDGRDVDLDFESPLTRGHEQEDVAAFQSFIQSVAPLGPEVMHMSMKTEDIPAWLARRTGLDPDLMRDDGEKQELAQLVAQMLAQQQMAQQQQKQGGGNGQ